MDLDLDHLKSMVEQMLKCHATWVGSAPVKDLTAQRAINADRVEVFKLSGHEKAQKAYAWSVPEGPQGEDAARYIAVLESPPVASAETAVLMWIVAKGAADD